MFEDKTYNNILSDLLKSVPSDLDKREGSVVYNALAPAAVELARLYNDLESVLNEAFADTASRYYLVKRAQERGLSPKNATYAEVKGRFDIPIPNSTRFSGGTLNYIVNDEIEHKDGFYYYRLVCESAGRSGNDYIGALIPINTDGLDGLTHAEITEILINGEDDEDVESFRTRYFSSITSQAFGGNQADYTEKALSIQGVGGVRVYPTWNGGGTVKLVIVTSDFDVPSAELVNEVQEAFDPKDKQGEGAGLAPIGHIVNVAGAAADTVSVTLKCVYETDYEWDDVKQNITAAIDEYLTELNRIWKEAENGKIIVRISHIESRVLGVSGIKDATAKINGADSNYEAGANTIVKLGALTEVTE